MTERNLEGKKGSQTPALRSASHIQNISLPKRKSLIRGLMVGTRTQESSPYFHFFWKPAKEFSWTDKLQEQGLYAYTVCVSVCLHPPFFVSSSSSMTF